VLARLARVVRERRVALLLRLGLLRGKERVERDLGIDDDKLLARQPHRHVRPKPPVVGLHRCLRDEVAVLDHAGHLDDVAQLELAPRLPGRGSAQGGAQAPRLGGKPLDADVQRAQGLAQAPIGLAALTLELLDLAFHLAELEADRFDDPLDLLRAPAQFPGRVLVVRETLGRNLARQRLPGVLEHVRRDRLHVAAQLLAIASHQLHAFLGGGQLEAVLFGARVEALVQAREFGLAGDQFAAIAA
jgi:hypothetical protein